MYRAGDFDSLAKDWECPPCGSGKNRFKVYQEGNAYDQMAAQKKANKAALAAKKKGGPSKRELLKQKMLEEQAQMDEKKRAAGSSGADDETVTRVSLTRLRDAREKRTTRRV